VYILITAVVHLPLALAAHRVLGARPRVARITTRIAGIAMVLVGAILLIERIAASVAWTGTLSAQLVRAPHQRHGIHVRLSPASLRRSPVPPPARSTTTGRALANKVTT
jgi:hypothetical protein